MFQMQAPNNTSEQKLNEVEKSKAIYSRKSSR